MASVTTTFLGDPSWGPTRIEGMTSIAPAPCRHPSPNMAKQLSRTGTTHRRGGRRWLVMGVSHALRDSEPSALSRKLCARGDPGGNWSGWLDPSGSDSSSSAKPSRGRGLSSRCSAGARPAFVSFSSARIALDAINTHLRPPSGLVICAQTRSDVYLRSLCQDLVICAAKRGVGDRSSPRT